MGNLISKTAAQKFVDEWYKHIADCNDPDCKKCDYNKKSLFRTEQGGVFITRRQMLERLFSAE